MDTDVAQQIFKGAEGIVKLSAQFAPVPGLVPAVDLLCALLIVCQNVQANKAEAEYLGQRCYQLAHAILQSCIPHSGEPLYVDDLAKQLISTLEVIMNRVSKMRSASFWDQFVKYSAWAKDIEKSNTEIEHFLQTYQTSATVTMLGLMRLYEEARRKDYETMMSAIERIPNKLSESQPEHPTELASFLQTEVFKQDAGSGRRALLVDTLNLVEEQTGAELPPMEIKDGVQIISSTPTTTILEGNNFFLWKGRFQTRTVGVRALISLQGSDDDKMRRLRRELVMWNTLWERDRGKHIFRILGYTLTQDEYGNRAASIITPWNENRHAMVYLTSHPEVDHTEIILNIARGVRILHSIEPSPLIHGDIRGENVEIADSDGRPLLAGFGLTKFADGSQTAQVTVSINAIQQPRFQAPEHQGNAATQSLPGDIYSFAMTMLQLLTHDTPFAKYSMMPQVCTMVTSGEKPERPTAPEVVKRGLNDAIWELMHRCWDFDPAKRPDIHRVLKDLKRAWPHLRNEVQ